MNKTSILTIAIIVASSVYLLAIESPSSGTIPYSEEEIDNSLVHHGLQSEEVPGQFEILTLKTFRQTGVDGRLTVDEFGNLVVDRNLRHWFDFYLSAIGEVSLDTIFNSMVNEINKLPSPANDQAMTILNNYLAYKKELADYEQREALSTSEWLSLDLLSDRLDWQKRLRRQWFDEEVVRAFWYVDEVIDQYAQDKLIISKSALSDQEKQEKLLMLDKQMPDFYLQYRNEVNAVSDLLSAEEDLMQEFAGNEGLSLRLKQLRTDLVGEDAAQRLMALDKQQDSWRKRIVSYKSEKYRIESMRGISGEDKKQLLKEYEKDNFEDAEILRLPAAIQLFGSNDVN